MSVRVVTAEQATALDAAAIAAGTPSRELMRTAGSRAALEIRRRLRSRLERGVTVYCGSGNNGGDGWIVAGDLAAAGYPVDAREISEPRSDDSRDARSVATRYLGSLPAPTDTAVIVDALLGTGSTGAPRGAIRDAINEIAARRGSGASVVCLDLPSGLDASSGSNSGAVRGDLTLSFATVKRGQLISREICGEIVCLDIGIGSSTSVSSTPLLIDAEWVRARVPRIPADAHKGTRGKVAIVGGGMGMAGAAILATRAALRSGAGLVRVIVHPENVNAVHAAVPSALVDAWPTGDGSAASGTEWADAIVLGPGLGTSADASLFARSVIAAADCPMVLDANAINLFAGDIRGLASAISGKHAVLTPHPREMSRLLGVDLESVLARRFEIGSELASASGATVLLKGTPTVVSAPNGGTVVSAAGTAALATGGSGDMLSGMIGTLLTGIANDLDAAACSAWVHGRAAELCGPVRGVTLEDVLFALPAAWNEQVVQLPAPILARLPSLQ